MARDGSEADVAGRKDFLRSFLCISTLIDVLLCLKRAGDSI